MTAVLKRMRETNLKGALLVAAFVSAVFTSFILLFHGGILVVAGIVLSVALLLAGALLPDPADMEFWTDYRYEAPKSKRSWLATPPEGDGARSRRVAWLQNAFNAMAQEAERVLVLRSADAWGLQVLFQAMAESVMLSHEVYFVPADDLTEEPIQGLVRSFVNLVQSANTPVGVALFIQGASSEHFRIAAALIDGVREAGLTERVRLCLTTDDVAHELAFRPVTFTPVRSWSESFMRLVIAAQAVFDVLWPHRQQLDLGDIAMELRDVPYQDALAATQAIHDAAHADPALDTLRAQAVIAPWRSPIEAAELDELDEPIGGNVDEQHA